MRRRARFDSHKKNPLQEERVRLREQCSDSEGTSSSCFGDCLSGLSGNPLECTGCDKANDQEVLSTETARVFPGVPVHIGSLKRDIEHRSFVSFHAPNARAHGTVANSLDGLRINFRRFFHKCCMCLLVKLNEIATPLCLSLKSKRRYATPLSILSPASKHQRRQCLRSAATIAECRLRTSNASTCLRSRCASSRTVLLIS